jgi:hypothetical protein
MFRLIPIRKTKSTMNMNAVIRPTPTGGCSACSKK